MVSACDMSIRERQAGNYWEAVARMAQALWQAPLFFRRSTQMLVGNSGPGGVGQGGLTAPYPCYPVPGYALVPVAEGD